MNRKRHAELTATLDELIHHKEDHILLMDLGPADNVEPRVTSLGKDFQPLEHEPVIV